MEITEELIPQIEKALGITLRDIQKDYLLKGTAISHTNRQAGKTTAFCIQLALSEGEPLDIRNPQEFSDGVYGFNRYEYLIYARGFFRSLFMEIWEKLNNAGLKVRPLRIGAVMYGQKRTEAQTTK